MYRTELNEADRNSLSEIFYAKVSRIPLLQGNELRRAPKIEVSRVPKEQWERMLFLGLLMEDNFIGLNAMAFNEIQPEILDAFGIERNLGKVIYVASQYEKRGRLPYFVEGTRIDYLHQSLLINLELNFPAQKSRYVRFEGCGSINWGRLMMFVARPEMIRAEACVYNPILGFGTPSKKQIFGGVEAMGMLTHEYDHTGGYDATNSPRAEIVDPFEAQEYLWSEAKRNGWLAVIAGLDDEEDETDKAQVLVRRDKKLMVVDTRGRYLKDFCY